MIDSINFVKGAVAKKDFVPNLTHFQICDGFIKGYNGEMAICSPISCDLNMTPHAGQFLQAITSCEDTVALSRTKSGKLSVSSSNFRVLVDCSQAEEFPDVEPKGELIEPTGSLLNALKTLEPFVSIDASKPWSTGILLRGKSAFATNNVIMGEYWLGYKTPIEVNIPATAIKEIIRINEEPVQLQYEKDSLTLHYENGRWLSTKLLALTWPKVSQVLEMQGDMKPIPEWLHDAVESISRFTDELGRVYFRGGKISTGANPEESRCALNTSSTLPEALFSYKHLLKVLKVATNADFERYPAPCPFQGENMRGVIVGMRQQ